MLWVSGKGPFLSFDEELESGRVELTSSLFSFRLLDLRFFTPAGYLAYGYFSKEDNSGTEGVFSYVREFSVDLSRRSDTFSLP